MTADSGWITAADAARTLGVTRATVYAYVSRGLIRSEARGPAPRERRYPRDDVERLKRRAEERRDPDKAAARALHWGMPVLESAITLIAGNRLYYRGHDAVELSRSRTIAEVASLIWTGRFDADLGNSRPGRLAIDRHLPFVSQAQVVLARAAVDDPLGLDLRPAAVAASGWRILHLLTAILARGRRSGPTIDGSLARAWSAGERGAELIRASLILCADHELNVSSFTARCVASAGSNPYPVVIAGLSALEGSRHGGATIRVESMLGSIRGQSGIRAALRERLRRGDAIEGFGHPLYPSGDPRAAALLQLAREQFPRSAAVSFADQVADASFELIRERPTIDFALAVVARVLRLPAGSAVTLFALGRTIGWIGQAIEQYGTGQIIRPRAKYVGPGPAGS
jgi:citrate synthase